MFEVGQQYWFRIKGDIKEFNLKGIVLDENNFFVKIKQDGGNESILSFNQIISVNKVKNINDVPKDLNTLENI